MHVPWKTYSKCNSFLFKSYINNPYSVLENVKMLWFMIVQWIYAIKF